MGCLCSCLEERPSDGKITSKTPLLGNERHKPNTTSQKQGASYVTMPPPSESGTPESHSVRQYRPETSTKKELTSSLDQVTSVTLAKLPTELAPLNKTFQDHGKLYNDIYDNFKEMRHLLNDFKSKFLLETAGIPVMAECLKVLSQRCGGAKLTAKREKYCIQLEYNAREISENCSGLPEDVLEALELYNKINRLVKNILEKSPQVSKSLSLVVQDEEHLLREVTKVDLPISQGPDVMRSCAENINHLRKLSGYIDTMQKYSDKIFKEIVEGSKVLLVETPVAT